MPELPRRKVGIIACSGEELPEGTVTRLAALKVLEELRPGDTVTICLPLFLAGGESDRAFARFYPTIAVDGCEKRCAFRGTEMYSNRPAASLVVTDLAQREALAEGMGSGSRLSPTGLQLVELAAKETAAKVDGLLDKIWSRNKGGFLERPAAPAPEIQSRVEPATCSCGSGIPVQNLQVNGREITLVALPLIFQAYDERRGGQEAPQPGMEPGATSTAIIELMEMVKIYNRIEQADEEILTRAVWQAYQEHHLQAGGGL